MLLGFIKAIHSQAKKCTLVHGRRSWELFLNFLFFFFTMDIIFGDSGYNGDKQTTHLQKRKQRSAGGWSQTAPRPEEYTRGPFYIPKEARLCSDLPGVWWEGVWGVFSRRQQRGVRMQVPHGYTLKGRYLIDGRGAAGATVGQVNASWKAFFGKLPPDSIAVETVRSGMCVRVGTRTHMHTHTPEITSEAEEACCLLGLCWPQVSPDS